ncbi:MAG: nitrilase-related carbon-nitrogen hydrolase [Armatimonadota bacterium]
MTIALCQIPMDLTISGNTRHITEAIATSGADLAIFPECALTGYNYVMGGDISRPNLTTAFSAIKDACQQSSTAAILGAPWFARDDHEKPWNAAVVIDRQGEIVSVQPKIVFTDDEIRNDIFLPADVETRTAFRLNGKTCAILICSEFAGVVGSYTSSHCYRLLEGLNTKLDIVFVIGVMDMSPNSKGSPLSQEAARYFDADFVIVNTAEWGFGTPSGNLGGSKVVSRSGELLVQAPFDQTAITLITL